MWSSKKKERPQIIRNYYWSIISSFNKVPAYFIFRASVYHGVWLHSFQIQIPLTLLLLGISLDLVAQLQMLSQRTPWPTDQSCGPIIHITFFKTFIMHSLSFGGYLLWRSAWLRSCCQAFPKPQPKFMLNLLPDIQLEIISLNFRSGSTLYKLPVLVLCPAQQAVPIFSSH